ncbi:MAG TPA: BMP family ABC transporter substrate-binding protein [Propioniciclava tarda]|nr:BMP family ABC transporter substrate-binding protein [Propioniciclava tarda]HQD60015.1 BMP family ABC transporter substrate-binding protein [Propioniciclava tarda]
MMDRRTFLLGSLSAAALATTGCVTNKAATTSTSTAAAPAAGASSAAAADSIKAAWVYVGPINDGGWTASHDAGRKYVAEKMGSKVITTYKENVPEGAQVAQVIEDLVKDGNKIIFATSFGFGEAMIASAKKHPDVKFLHGAGAWHNPQANFGTYYGATEEAKYLAGIAAAKATKSGTIGFVAPFLIPEVIRHINALALGARSVNPAAKVKVVEIKSWFDPTKERQAADSLITQGADVIVNGGDSPAPGEAAKAKNLPWVGYDSDQSANFPDIWLTAPIYNWGPYYLKQVQSALDGTWKKEDYYGNLKDGFNALAPFGKIVTADTKALIEEKKAKIIDGSLDIFAGPLKDNKGAEKVASGATVSADDRQAMSWLVEGVS